MPNGELMKPRLVQNKVPIKDIQIWLGHSNIQTTMIYTHMDETNKKCYCNRPSLTTTTLKKC